MTVREQALKVLLAVEQGAQLDDELGRTQVAPQDRGLLTEMAYGTTRHRGRLDFALQNLSRHPLSRMPLPSLMALRLGAYQLLFLERVPASAAVNESVKLVRRWGHAGLVKLANALLRKLAATHQQIPWPSTEDAIAHLSVCGSLPAWLAKDWLGRFGAEEAERLASAMLQQAPTWVRLNRLSGSDVALPGEAGALPWSFRPDLGGDPSAWPGFAEGRFYVQDLGSQAVGVAVDPQPGERVIDLCAAPGGKSTQLAEMMHNQGQVVAVELEPRRAQRIEENVRRLGVTSVAVAVGDARTLDLGPADRVLVDAPCSGLGVLRRKPDIKWHAPRPHLPTLQLELAERAASLVKPGGVLVYSTCTLQREENEDVVEALLARHPELAPDDWGHLLPEAWRSDLRQGMIQLLPHRHGTDGFFIARLRKQP